MDIVYILKSWYDNCLELRYSLRSLENIKHWKVFIIWYKPEWINNVIHIKAEDPFEVKALNALHKITIACEDDRVSNDFILMNDDFYITKPTEIKYYHQGLIKEHLLRRTGQNSAYANNLYKTFRLFPKWNDYSLHYPIVYNKYKFLEMCEIYNMEQGYLLRNLYCNHFKVWWEQAKDYKILDATSLPKETPTFISNIDCLIVSDEFKNYLNKLFPNQSKYENNK